MKKFILFSLISLLFSNTSFALDKAPNWQLKQQDGTTISLADYHGKPVILHFWATWCPYCKRLQPHLVKLQQKYAAQGVEIVAVSFMEDDDAKPQSELKQRGYTFKTAVHGEQVAEIYGVTGTPTTFFINRKGEIIYRTSSSNTRNKKFEQAVKLISQP